MSRLRTNIHSSFLATNGRESTLTKIYSRPFASIRGSKFLRIQCSRFDVGCSMLLDSHLRSRFTCTTFRSPSPLPSPSGRGGTLPRSANGVLRPQLGSHPNLVAQRQNCSLSLRERVRVRGNERHIGSRSVTDLRQKILFVAARRLRRVQRHLAILRRRSTTQSELEGVFFRGMNPPATFNSRSARSS